MGETNPQSFKEAVQVAETYAEARRTFRLSPRKDKRPAVSSSSDVPVAQGSNRDSQGPSAQQTPWGVRKCFLCGKAGHIRKDCPRNPHPIDPITRGQGRQREQLQFARSSPEMCPVFLSLVEGQIADTIRDSGATGVFMDQSLVPAGAQRGPDCEVAGIESEFLCRRPTYLVEICTPYFEGKVWVVALKSPAYSLLLGNSVRFAGGKEGRLSTSLPERVFVAATTRTMAKQDKAEIQPVLRPALEALASEVDPQDVRRLQEIEPQVKEECTYVMDLRNRIADV